MAEGETLDQDNNAQGNEWEVLHDEDGLTPEEVEAAWRRRLGRNPEGEAALGPNYNILSQDMGLFPEGTKPKTEPPIDDSENGGPDNGGDDEPNDGNGEPGEDGNDSDEDNDGGDDIEIISVDPIPPIAPNPPEDEDGGDDEEEEDDDDDGDDWADEHLKDPLTAVEAGFDFDAEQLARVEAEETINRETKGKFFQRLWKKTLFKKFYERKYTDEIMTGERKVKVMEGGDENHEMSISEIMKRRSDSTIRRFVMAAITGERQQFLSEEIGGKQGETMVEADKETYEKVKSNIEWFAQAEIPEGQTLEDLKRSFRQRMGYERAANQDKGEPVNDIRFNNYLELAIQAREAVEHHVSMERVMDGFKVYEAEARSGFRTEEHRDNIDKAINWLENHPKIGSLVPAQALAVGASVASFFFRGSISALFGAFGGIAANGIIAGLRERNRITEDRAHMLRNASIDRAFAGTSEAIAAQEKNRSRKQEKYEAKIGGTLYQLEKATDLESDIAKAMESEEDNRGQNILSAIAAAEARIELSNSEAKDLIAFSSADKRGDEYLALLTTIHKAKKLLSDEEKSQLDIIKNRISRDVLGHIAEQDAKFGNTRALMTLGKTAKSIGVGALTFFGSQEVMALVDPGKLGLLEKLGLVNTANKADANQTILTELFTGPNIKTTTVNLSEYDIAQRDALKGAGYNETMTTPPGTRMETSVADVPLSQAKARIKYDTIDWANNGTSYSDYNELRIGGTGAEYLTCVMHGKSTYGGGNVIDYAQELAAGRIKGIMTMADGSQFEIMPFVDDSGQMAFSHAGDYITTDGSIISGVGDGFRFFQIMADRGGNAGISLATEVGKGTFGGTVQEIVNKIIPTPAEYTLSLSENIAMDTSGFFLPSFWPRTGLGPSRQRPERRRPSRERPIPPRNGPNNSTGQDRIQRREPQGGGDSPPPPPPPPGVQERERRRETESGGGSTPPPPPPPPGAGGAAVQQQRQVAQAGNVGFEGVQMPEAGHESDPIVTQGNEETRPVGVRPTQDVPVDRVEVMFPDIPQEVESNLRQIYQDWASTFEQRERENNPAINDNLLGHYHSMVEAARSVIGDRGVQLLTEPNMGSVELQNPLEDTPDEFGQILGEHLNIYYNELDEAGRAAVVQYFDQLRDTQGIEGFSTIRLGALDREEFSAWYNQLDDNQQHQIDRLMYDLSNNRLESWYDSLDDAGKQTVYRLFGLRDRMQRFAVNSRVTGAAPTKGIDEALGFVYWMYMTKDPWGNQWVRSQNELTNSPETNNQESQGNSQTAPNPGQAVNQEPTTDNERRLNERVASLGIPTPLNYESKEMYADGIPDISAHFFSIEIKDANGQTLGIGVMPTLSEAREAAITEALSRLEQG